MSKVYTIEIINGKPVRKSAHVVRIVDYVYNQLAETGEYNMIINDQSLLAESKRLNDEMRYCLESRNI